MEDHFSEHPTSYAAEQRKIKESFLGALDEESDSDGSEGFLKKRVKSQKETQKEEADYLDWLRGHKEELEDTEEARDLVKS